MVEVKVNQPETLLNREQLREVERFQAKFAELERQLHHCVDEFLSVLNRHYFNRENGFLSEQQENLREIVTIQSKLESLAANMATGSTELKNRMLELQRELQKQSGAAQGTARPKTSPAEQPLASQEEVPQSASEKPDRQNPSTVPSPVAGGMIDREGQAMADTSESGGEISLRLVFEGLRLTDSANSEALGTISTALRKLLYDRKLVGYSKTSLVFGKNKTMGEVLQDLTPIFLSTPILELMRAQKLIDPGEGERLALACNQSRELIYTSGK